MDVSRRTSSFVFPALTAITLAAVLWALRDTFAAMWEIWLTSSSFNHCLLIAPVSGLLIWRRRHRLAQIAPRASAGGAAVFALSALLWALGAIGSITTLQNLAAVAMTAAVFWALLGREVVREIAFPLGFLFFMVPIGEFLVPRLMQLTAEVTVAAARASGVSVYKDGLLFTIPSGSFKIVEACSGIRMLIASIAIAALFAHLAFVSWTRRIVFVAAMVVASLLANGVRTYTVVMVAYYAGMETVARHVMVGYAVFGIVIVVMLLAGSRYADDRAIARNSDLPRGEPGSPLGALLAGSAAVAVAFAMPVAAAAVEAAAGDRQPAPPMLLPAARGGWRGPEAASEDWAPRYRGYDTAVSGSYRSGPASVDAHLLSWSRQEQGAELINALNRIFDRRRWTKIQQGPAAGEFGGGRRLWFVETELRSRAGARRLVRHWYIVDGQTVRSPLAAKLSQLKNALLGRPTPATLVAVGASFGADREVTARSLDAFIEDVYLPSYPADP
ncbi:MAG: exosortase A [Gammaproteobacteria bacterium]